MHIEVQVALNFVISYLYNKLPRRRVNLFGEELEKALKQKFDGHWYPERPFKGSAYRCLRVSMPVDPVIEQAARESGVEVVDIRENLPEDLSVWIDPGEVSYRIGEKGAVKVLYSETEMTDDCALMEGEVKRSFNPEAQCFKPVESLASSLTRLSLSPGTTTTSTGSSQFNGNSNGTANNGNGGGAVNGEATSPVSPGGSSFKAGATSPIQAFIPKAAAPVTFTTASFAQTKFGSTKLKTSGKRSHRLSPTEFSNYIKQRAIQQQLQGSPTAPTSSTAPSPRFRGSSPQPQQRPRSLSPKPTPQPQLDPFLMMAAAHPSAFGGPRALFDNYLGDLSSQAAQIGGFPDGAFLGGAAGVGMDGMALNSLPYSARYQHLLVAN